MQAEAAIPAGLVQFRSVRQDAANTEVIGEASRLIRGKNQDLSELGAMLPKLFERIDESTHLLQQDLLPTEQRTRLQKQLRVMNKQAERIQARSFEIRSAPTEIFQRVRKAAQELGHRPPQMVTETQAMLDFLAERYGVPAPNAEEGLDAVGAFLDEVTLQSTHEVDLDDQLRLFQAIETGPAEELSGVLRKVHPSYREDAAEAIAMRVLNELGAQGIEALLARVKGSELEQQLQLGIFQAIVRRPAPDAEQAKALAQLLPRMSSTALSWELHQLTPEEGVRLADTLYTGMELPEGAESRLRGGSLNAIRNAVGVRPAAEVIDPQSGYFAFFRDAFAQPGNSTSFMKKAVEVIARDSSGMPSPSLAKDLHQFAMTEAHSRFFNPAISLETRRLALALISSSRDIRQAVVSTPRGEDPWQSEALLQALGDTLFEPYRTAPEPVSIGNVEAAALVIQAQTGQQLDAEVAKTVRSAAEQLGAETIELSSVPLVFGSEDHGARTYTLMRVGVPNSGKEMYVDEHHRIYQSIDDFYANNTLPAGSVMVDGFASDKTPYDPNQPYIDIAIGGIGMGAAVSAMVIGGPVTAGIALGAGVVSNGYFAYRGAETLDDRLRHGQSINPFTEPEARQAIIDVVTGSLGLGALSAEIRAAKLASRGLGGQARAFDAAKLAHKLNKVDFGAALASTLSAADQLIDNWHQFTPQERLAALAPMVLGAGLMAGAARGLNHSASRLDTLRFASAEEQLQALRVARQKLGQFNERLVHEMPTKSPQAKSAEAVLAQARAEVRQLQIGDPGLSESRALAKIMRSKPSMDASHKEALLRLSASVQVRESLGPVLGSAGAGPMGARVERAVHRAFESLEAKTAAFPREKLEADLLRAGLKSQSVGEIADLASLQFALHRVERRMSLAPRVVEDLGDNFVAQAMKEAALPRRLVPSFVRALKAHGSEGWALSKLSAKNWSPDIRYSETMALLKQTSPLAAKELGQLSVSEFAELMPNGLSKGMADFFELRSGASNFLKARPEAAHRIALALESHPRKFDRFLFDSSRNFDFLAKISGKFLPDLRTGKRVGDFNRYNRSIQSSSEFVPEAWLVLRPRNDHNGALQQSVAVNTNRKGRKILRKGDLSNFGILPRPEQMMVRGAPLRSYDGVLVVATHGGSNGSYAGVSSAREMANMIVDQFQENSRLQHVVLVCCHQRTLDKSTHSWPARTLHDAVKAELRNRGMPTQRYSVLASSEEGTVGAAPRNLVMKDPRSRRKWVPALFTDAKDLPLPLTEQVTQLIDVRNLALQSRIGLDAPD